MNHRYLILYCALIAALIITGYISFSNVWKFGTGEKSQEEPFLKESVNVVEKLEEKKMSHKLPEEIKDRIVNIGYSARLAISKWDVYPEEKTIVFNVYEKPSDEKIQNIENTRIDNWTLKIKYDDVFHDQMTQTRMELNALKNDPAYKIAYYEIDDSPYYESPRIFIVVHEFTEKNQKLNGTRIQGWEIVQVSKAVLPPPQI